MEEIQKGWNELKLRVEQLEADRGSLRQENHALRVLLERAIDHRQKSHSELVTILATLVSKLPLNDIGVIISRLVEHNTNVSHALADVMYELAPKITAQVEGQLMPMWLKQRGIAA